jgi:uncharacterized protein (TIGR02271 family)
VITEKMTRDIIGRQAFDASGEKVGKIGQVYVDDRDGTPTWATVNTGLFGMKESFVPLDGADIKDGDVALSVAKSQVKDAPRVGDSSDHLDAPEEQELRRHYGAANGLAGTNGTNGHNGHGTNGTDARDARGTRDAADSMTRSEERLRVGTETEETGRVRLRKYVVTEEQRVTVPVSHEEVRLEREPIRGEQGREGTIGEAEHEVTLHAERPVVGKTTEAVERVRLGTETVTEDHTVSDQVRKERVEIDDPKGHLSK